MTDQLVTFAPETPKQDILGTKPWKVLIADDDEEIHTITKLALNDYTYQGQPIQFFDSYTRNQTMDILREQHDIALLLLDVVMDDQTAGLDVVEFLRNTLNEHTTRIVLRTGEAGSAPEIEMVNNYDINDYKEKTELSSTKLYTAVHTSIKSYADLRTIKASRAGFTKIIGDAADLYGVQDVRVFIRTAIEQFANLVQVNPDVILLKSDGRLDAAAFRMESKDLTVKSIVGTGRFKSLPEQHAADLLSDAQMRTVLTAAHQRKAVFENGVLACGFSSPRLGTFVLLFEGLGILANFDQTLINVFLSHICRAMENADLYSELNETRAEIIFKLGEIVEFRSAATSQHVIRVSMITKILATSLGWDQSDIDDISVAAVLHDVGKIAVEDSILNKPGKLTSDEFEEVKKHTLSGYRLLKCSSRHVMQIAADIALDHHEKWDGSGYPSNKRDRDISIYARIVAIADVYDALRSERVYKVAWGRRETLDHIISERGKHFDPLIVDHLERNEAKINALFSDDHFVSDELEWGKHGFGPKSPIRR